MIFLWISMHPKEKEAFIEGWANNYDNIQSN
jgi:hypothetical protein